MFMLLLSLVVLYHKFCVRYTSLQLIPWGMAFHKKLAITLLAPLLSLMFITMFTRDRTTNHTNNMNIGRYSFYQAYTNQNIYIYKF